ncbi:3-hydroxyisobutyryl-CoA hydrolase, mitochondrial-like isoform X2 [Ptychodera flava]|uniref:3-hydroxyisobutyryl-CoA hydrolase, mitochondrial-like isoform X2 n=1 Tax=Ptychodera flava TaxID=63121 RepID=UPI00396A899C
MSLQILCRRQTVCRVRLLTQQLRAMSGVSAEDDVILEKINKKGVITLNRPKALNALNLSMIRKIYPQLKQWEEDGETSLVIIKGSGEKSFCAGGDIKAVTDAGRKGDRLSADFFREEYILNYAIGTLQIPYIALIDGITMGGGVGLSVHGHFRVATPRTLFAMPETGIGLFPDVGGGYFLPRLGGKLGIYLALSGFRLRGRDVHKAGVATHFVDQEQIADVEKALLDLDSPNENEVRQVLDRYHQECTVDKHKEFVLSPHLEKIDQLFCGDTVEDIMEALRKDGSEWANKQLQTLLKMSPTSMKITLRQLQEGERMSFADCFTMEYRISQGCIDGHDFYEGVRALLVDKDNAPKWKPATVEEVTQDIVESHFKPLDFNRDLTL